MQVEVRKPSQEELVQLGVLNWPIWEKEESSFDWHYDDKEICYLLEGQVTVETEPGQVVNFGAGDLVTFPKGLTCKWQIIQSVKKHYNFG